jgi:hypothetical protein
VEAVEGVRAEAASKLERKANLHDMMGRHAELTEILQRKVRLNTSFVRARHREGLSTAPSS